MFKKLQYHVNNYKFSLVSIVIILGTIGLVLIQKLQDSDENQFERQLYGLLFGLFVMFVVSLIDYHRQDVHPDLYRQFHSDDDL